MDNLKLSPEAIKAAQSLSSDRNPRDPVSIAQCAKCRKKCTVPNVKGECHLSDIAGETFNLSRGDDYKKVKK